MGTCNKDSVKCHPIPISTVVEVANKRGVTHVPIFTNDNVRVCFSRRTPNWFGSKLKIEGAQWEHVMKIL